MAKMIAKTTGTIMCCAIYKIARKANTPMNIMEVLTKRGNLNPVSITVLLNGIILSHEDYVLCFEKYVEIQTDQQI